MHRFQIKEKDNKPVNNVFARIKVKMRIHRCHLDLNIAQRQYNLNYFIAYKVQ